MDKKKMKFPFLFKATEATAPWPWPSCGKPRTPSFRVGGDVFKTMNSAYVHAADVDLPESWFATSNSQLGSFSVEPEEAGGGESVEAVIRGLRSSERLFFEPGETSSILGEAKSDGFRLKESVVLEMESEDPYLDFKRSMEEMVEAHGLKDWDGLEELLSWYLKINGKKNHGFIVGAFVDLLVGLGFATSSSSSSSSSSSLDADQSSSSASAHSPTSPLLFCSSTDSTTSPCLSSLEAEEEIEKTVDNGSSSSDA